MSERSNYETIENINELNIILNQLPIKSHMLLLEVDWWELMSQVYNIAQKSAIIKIYFNF